MKIQTKRRGRILSARKSIIEQTKMRQGFERRLYKQMVSYFNSTGRQASREIQSGRVELKGLEESLSQVLLPHYRSVIESFANRFVFTKQENQWERIIRNYITTQGGAKITRISGTTRNKINKIISDGQVEGFGVDKIAKNIRTQMSEPFTRYRSALIARTETHNASSYTNQAVAESYEVPMKKRWVSTNDDRTRGHHSAMNGVEVDIEADFDVPYKGVTYKMKHAGDPRGGPANVINCRCVILYVEPDDFVIDEEEPREKPVQITPTTIPDVPIAFLLNTGSKSLRKRYDEEFNSQLTQQQKIIVDKLDKPEAIRNVKKGKYLARRGELRAKLGKKDGEFKSYVISHEYGHHIDYVSNKSKSTAWSESNQDFQDAIIADKRKLGGVLNNVTRDVDLPQDATDELFDIIATRETVTKYGTLDPSKIIAQYEITVMNGNGFSNVSDIIDALTKGKFQRDYSTWGHGVSYYRGEGRAEKEIFANLFCIRNDPDAYNVVKIIIPNTVKQFEKRLDELEKMKPVEYPDWKLPKPSFN